MFSVNNKQDLKKILDYLCLFRVHDFVLNQITLVPNKKLADTVIRISVYFTQPLLDIVETFHLSNIINNLKKSQARTHHSIFPSLYPRKKKRARCVTYDAMSNKPWKKDQLSEMKRSQENNARQWCDEKNNIIFKEKK